MREEQINMRNIEIPKLYQEIKKYLQDELKLQIIHEEKFDSYWSIKAYRGGKVNTLTGSVRDVEVMISGTGSSTTSQDSYDLVLRTGAWGRDIFVPGVIAGLVAGVAGAGVVAGLEIFRAYSFEKTFWNWLNGKIEKIGGGKASVSMPQPL